MGQNKELAENILDAVGGNQNIKSVTHCMTRLRFSLVDESIIDDETIKQIDGVMGIRVSSYYWDECSKGL